MGELPQLLPEQGRLDVYFLDVSLGDAIYIRTPTGEDVVIDGGDSSTELSSFLDMLGEASINVVIVTHPHADHVGGLPKVILERKPPDIWTNGQEHSTQIYAEVEAAIQRSGTTKHAGKPGDGFDVGGVRFSIVAPARLKSNLNDSSLVVRMDCGSSSFLFAGDAETGSENDMIAAKRDLDIDILKLGHHGSRTSTSQQMILATSPRLAVYSARAGNQFGHPHAETLGRLSAENVPTFGTKDAGSTVVVSTTCDDQFSVTPRLEGFPTLAPALP